jgi:hypothetical protein
MRKPSAAVYGRAGCNHFHSQCSVQGACLSTASIVWTCWVCPFLSPAVWTWNEQKCRCRTQPGTGILLYRTEIQNAGMPMPAASTLDADAQLCTSIECFKASMLIVEHISARIVHTLCKTAKQLCQPRKVPF